MPPTTTIAVLTGDLVGHLRKGPAATEAAMRAIAAAADAMAGRTGQPSPRFTRFRGDGWQMYLTMPALSLRAAVVIQGRLMALGMESRIAIGIGPADSLGTTNLADAAGPAFETSGRALDAMGDAWRLHIAGAGVLPQDAQIADLIGERMQRWTPAQAEAAALRLASPDRVVTLFDIGRTLGISPQAVNDRLRGAGSNVLESVLRRWEKVAVRGNAGPDP
jgi:hypothetical protein